jgi:hypothetical protein
LRSHDEPVEALDDEDVRALIAEYPLAWVVARGTDDGDRSLCRW